VPGTSSKGYDAADEFITLRDLAEKL